MDPVHQSERPGRETSTLAGAIHHRIKDENCAFRTAPGQRDAGKKLADRFGVSRTPRRLPSHVLAREGYLKRIDGHAGWQAKSLDLDDFEDLYDLRVQIELIGVRRICSAEPPPDLSALRGFWCVPVAQRVPDGPVGRRADEERHSTLVAVAVAGHQEMKRVHADLGERVCIIRWLDSSSPNAWPVPATNTSTC